MMECTMETKKVLTYRLPERIREELGDDGRIIDRIKGGLTVEIKVKKGHDAEIVLNKLYEHTALQSSFGIINIALIGGKPKLLTLYEMLSAFLGFREEVIRRRTAFLLRKAERAEEYLQQR